MRLITIRSQIREVAAKWTRQYPPGCKQAYAYRLGEHDAIRSALLALDVETATAADVAAIIGNGSWADEQECHGEACATRDEYGCVNRKRHAVVVQVGDEPDCESHTANLCLSCARQAVAMIESVGAVGSSA